MRCQRCHAQDALEKNGAPAMVRLFEDIEGYFCATCVVELQEPFNADLRRSIAARAPALTEADLAAVPDQMLKFTLCLPIQPTPGSGTPTPGRRAE